MAIGGLARGGVDGLGHQRLFAVEVTVKAADREPQRGHHVGDAGGVDSAGAEQPRRDRDDPRARCGCVFSGSAHGQPHLSGLQLELLAEAAIEHARRKERAQLCQHARAFADRVTKPRALVGERLGDGRCDQGRVLAGGDAGVEALADPRARAA